MLISVEDFKAVDFEAAIRDSKKVDYLSLYRLFRDRAKQYREAGCNKTASVMEFLSEICQIVLRPTKDSGPFHPAETFGDRRTMIPSDLPEKQTEVLASIAESIENPGLRARIADIAWINKRQNVAMAKLAIEAYCEAVRRVLHRTAEFRKSDSVASDGEGYNMLKRACQIAKATGWKKQEASALKSLVQEVSKDALDRGDPSGYICASDISLTFNIEDPTSLATNAEKLVARNENQLRRLWRMAARAYGASKRTQDVHRCRFNVAEILMCKSVTVSERSATEAAGYVSEAIKEIKNIPGPKAKAKRQEFKKRLVALQRESTHERFRVATRVDLTQATRAARQMVKSKPLFQAMESFASLCASPDPATLCQDTLECARSSPLWALSPRAHTDRRGMVTSVSDGLTAKPDGEEAHFQHLVAEVRQNERQRIVKGRIRPARKQIFEEHRPERSDFLQLIKDQAKADVRGNIFAAGLASFFVGDFITAVHILVPQLEYLLRRILNEAGIEPSVIGSDTTQASISLSTMLCAEENRKILDESLGPALVSDLKSVFDERKGPHLRHRLAHGLIVEKDCFGTDSIYGCWLIIRLFWFVHFGFEPLPSAESKSMH